MAAVVGSCATKADPSDGQWQRDLALTYIGIGDVAGGTRQSRSGAEAYRGNLVINDRVAKADPGNEAGTVAVTLSERAPSDDKCR